MYVVTKLAKLSCISSQQVSYLSFPSPSVSLHQHFSPPLHSTPKTRQLPPPPTTSLEVNLLQHRIPIQTQIILNHAIRNLLRHLALGHLMLRQIFSRKPASIDSAGELVFTRWIKADFLEPFDCGGAVVAAAGEFADVMVVFYSG
jgi:hypothetical protein